MKRDRHQHNEKSVGQVRKRESFRERGGCLQLRRKQLATLLVPLCAQTGFNSEAEACWPGAVRLLETKTRLINKRIRITGSMDRSLKD